MLTKMAEKIVKFRWAILALSIVLTVVCVPLIGKATINYDFTQYLDKSTMTSRTLEMMNGEFASAEQIAVMFSNLDGSRTPEEIAAEMNGWDGVMRASYDPETDAKTVEGVRYDRINLFLDAEDAVAFTRELKDILDGWDGFDEYALDGSAPQTLDIQKNIGREMPIAMGIAVAVVLGVLFLTAHSPMEPVLFMLVLMVSIAVNMGTNWIFSSISFVTFAVAAILQLALAMDYSIMLLNSFFELRDTGLDDREAVVKALSATFMPIVSSSLTTVAGLGALMFMSFTIGFDIGIVLAKGILISMICVFTLMPALILLFRKPLRHTVRRRLPLGGKQIGALALKTRKVLPILLILVILVSAAWQSQNEYTFTDVGSSGDADKVRAVFGQSNALVLLFPAGESDEDYAAQRALAERLKKIEYEGKPAVANITGMVTTGEDAIRIYNTAEVAKMLNMPEFLVSAYLGTMGFSTSVRGDLLVEKAAEIMPGNAQIQELRETMEFAKSMFIGKEYARMIILLDAPGHGEKTYRVLDEIIECLRETYPDGEVGITGGAMSSYDISSAFDSDVLRVSLITIAAIFLIVMVSFRSLSVPALLICVIQGSIWVNLAISAAIGESIFFMCYLVFVAIQMGATIDYAILMTSHYCRMRRTQERKQAILTAVTLSMPTVFTSGVILIVAGFVIGQVCTVYYISSIGSMLARGATISVLLILLLLPPLLVNLDRWIVRKK